MEKKTVYLVSYEFYNGGVSSAWETREQAQAEADRCNAAGPCDGFQVDAVVMNVPMRLRSDSEQTR